MSGFAGSERVGERRRRRLAVGSEGSDTADSPQPPRNDSLLRFFENAGREASALSARECPVLTVVSARAWKHWCCALLALAAGLAILVADFAWPNWGAANGPKFARWLAGPASPILPWANSLSLFLTAQAAAIVWWARSRSLRDFNGSFRIWAWASATWLLFSFASATQANLVWSETILFHIKWKTPGAVLWCWLLPASAWGWGLALRLEQEMRDNRPAHWLFLLAGTWYLAVVAILCQREFWPQACSPDLSSLLLAVSQLLGHSSLLLCHALHARFVLSCTAEPPLAKRRQQAKSAAQAPAVRSWLRFLSLSWWLGFGKATAEEEEAKPKRGRKKAATKKKSSSRKATRAAAEAEEESEETAEEGWDSEETGEDEAEEVASGEESAEEDSGKNYRFDDAEGLRGGHASHYGEDPQKGLSKRDRRRMQQQMREQERRGSR